MQKGNGGGGRATPSLFKNKAGRKEPSTISPLVATAHHVVRVVYSYNAFNQNAVTFYFGTVGYAEEGRRKAPQNPP